MIHGHRQYVRTTPKSTSEEVEAEKMFEDFKRLRDSYENRPNSNTRQKMLDEAGRLAEICRAQSTPPLVLYELVPGTTDEWVPHDPNTTQTEPVTTRRFFLARIFDHLCEFCLKYVILISLAALVISFLVSMLMSRDKWARYPTVKGPAFIK